jgi:hypothetical protein
MTFNPGHGTKIFNCSETVHCDRDDVVNYRISVTLSGVLQAPFCTPPPFPESLEPREASPCDLPFWWLLLRH